MKLIGVIPARYASTGSLKLHAVLALADVIALELG